MDKLKKVLKEIDINNEAIDRIYMKAKLSPTGKVPKKMVNEYERLLQRKNLLLDDLNRYSL